MIDHFVMIMIVRNISALMIMFSGPFLLGHKRHNVVKVCAYDCDRYVSSGHQA